MSGEHTTEAAAGPSAPAPRGRDGTRVGYVVAAMVNLALLWAVHHVVEWGWPGFVTADFENVVPAVSWALGVSIAVNLCFMINDRWPVKPAGEATTSVLGGWAAWRVYSVFPFEFGGVDWSWLIRLFLIVAMIGSVVDVVVQLARLLRGPDPT